jgi:hypothetical protein
MRVSVSSSGGQGTADSDQPSISGNGRYVAFHSHALNLVHGGTTASGNVFIHDMVTGTTTLASVSSDGAQGDNLSANPSLNGDGRYVAFESVATNLVPGQTAVGENVYVHDMVTGTTTNASLNRNGGENRADSLDPAISADGRFVAFSSWANNLVIGDSNNQYDVFEHDMTTGTTIRVSLAAKGSGWQANNLSLSPSISGDGRYVAFESLAANLVPGDTNGHYDIFVRDTWAHDTAPVSTSSSGGQADRASRYPSISAEGTAVGLQSVSANLESGDTKGFMDVFKKTL